MEFCLYLLVLGCTVGVQAIQQDCQESADIIFLVDSSWSIRENKPANQREDNWKLIKEFMISVVKALPVQTGEIRIGVVKFSTNVHNASNELIYLNSHGPNDTADLNEKIANLAFYPGNTNTSSALRTLHQYMIDGYHGGRAEVGSIAILITDGPSDVDSDKTVPEARVAKMKGIRIFGIGITEYADGSELEEISSDPVDYHYIRVKDFINLPHLLDKLIERICVVKPPPPTRCKNARADVVFLLDNSGSIQEKDPKNQPNYNWNLLKGIVIEVVRNLQVDALDTRVAVIRFSDKAEVMFPLGTYNKRSEIIEAVEGLIYTRGATNTSGALRTMRETVFSAAFGDRPTVRNVGIIITDGESTVDKNLYIPEAMKTHAADIKMFVIGLTDFRKDKELKTLASDPTEDYYFQIANISYVETLVSRLVWGVCNSQYRDLSEKEQRERDVCKKPDETACPERKYIWKYSKGRLLVGHNYARVQHVGSATECQRVCLKDPYCKSIDYVSMVNECAVSYVTKDDAPESFAEDSGSDYYELVCDIDPSVQEQRKTDSLNKQNETACPEKYNDWKHSKGHLVGYDCARIQYVWSAHACQGICLKDPYCKSIDYLSGDNECAVSYVTKDDAPESFAEDSGSDYYELECDEIRLKCFVCEGEYSTTSKCADTFDTGQLSLITSCRPGHTFCKKTKSSFGPWMSKIVRSCAASCVEQDDFGGSTTCCTTDRCNSGYGLVPMAGLVLTIAVFLAIK